MIVISALDLDTCSVSTEVFTGSITSCQTMIVMSTFDWFTFILLTNEFGIRIGVEITGGIHFLPAMFVFTADLIFTLVTKTFVSFFESAADLFVTTMFSVQTFNIDTLIIPT